MLPTELEKLNKIQQDMVELGEHVLHVNKDILSVLEAREISKIASVELYSKKTWRERIAEIDNQIIHVCALYSPEARDLRQLVAFLKVTNEFDRIENSCRSFIRDLPSVLSGEMDQESILEYAIPLQKTCVKAVKNATALLNTEDKEEVNKLYKSVVLEEDKNDELYKMIEKSLLNELNENIHLSREYQVVMSALRRLEKIADRSLSIAVLMHYARIGGTISKPKVSVKK
jgi:phosphate transport system protein